MKLKILLFLILTSGLLFFGPSFVKSEEETVLTVTEKMEDKNQKVKDRIL
mgnify:FL=1